MSGPQVIGLGAVAPTAAIVLPNTGVFNYVVFVGIALVVMAFAYFAVRFGKSAAKKATK